jgi:hypothetical protein
MGRINAEWHRGHVMPKNANQRQRAQWHYEHARNCGCREITPSIAALLETEGFDVPRPPRESRPR